MSTIAAISTAIGTGGISIIRMSGKDTFKILDRIFKQRHNQDINEIRGYSIKYGLIIDNKTNQNIDEVLVSYFKAPESYTREDMCEINSHGGMVVTKQILELCLREGAVLAEPGEFTKRAFINGRIDLSQAESVIDIINAKTEKEAKSSLKQLEGALSKDIKKIKEDIMEIMVQIEASIDYPEYDVEEVTINKANLLLKKVKNKLIALQKTFRNGKILKEGVEIAIIGKPNAGKSSLLNAILREERAIVTEVEGTTRDTIEEYINIEGIPFKIIDTAGIRNAKDQVEKIGIEKAKEIAKEADFIIVMIDASGKLSREDEEVLKQIEGKNALIALNKIDKDQIITGESKEIEKWGKPIVEISATNKIGIDKIFKTIIDKLQIGEIETNDNYFVTNQRHKEAINNAIKNVEEAIITAQNNMPIDIIAINIKEILESLGKITGESVSDNIIQEIFKKFCLGK